MTTPLTKAIPTEGPLGTLLLEVLSRSPIEILASSFGRGVFAKQDLPANAVILAERPLLCESRCKVPQVQGPGGSNIRVVLDLFRTMAKHGAFPGNPNNFLDHLHVHDSPELSSRASMFSKNFVLVAQRWGYEWSTITKMDIEDEWTEICNTETIEELYRRLATNLFQGQLYLAGSFLNHSCCPNAGWMYLEDKHVYPALVTQDPIPKGSEVFISYTTTDPEGVEQLHDTYGIDCRLRGTNNRVGSFLGCPCRAKRPISQVQDGLMELTNALPK